MIVLGVDPGLHGAVAILGYEGGACSKAHIHDMPIAPGPKGKADLLHRALIEILQSLPPSTCWVERVGAMPGQGIASAFRFGATAGAIHCAVAAAGHELRLVTPAVWKKHFGITADKDGARSLASQRIPSLAPAFVRVKDADRAEAALIALYGAEKAGMM